ncbi:MAG: HAMP domain-containing histidine kinase [Spirochaetales bacterium]|nr:HAMP domain-containing histidine kinase [Spirochaetales bacterium]
MRLKKPKWLLFQIIGGVLIAGAIVLGYFQYVWISTATKAEENRIRKEINLTFDRALDSAFDEIRALISFSYVSSENLRDENWADVDTAIKIWRETSAFPALLEAVYLLPTAQGESYREYDSLLNGFVEVDMPGDFQRYNELRLSANPIEAYQLALPRLLTKGYFLVPISGGKVGSDSRPQPEPTGSEPTGPEAILTIKINSKLLYGELIPSYISDYVNSYDFRIIDEDETLHTTLGPSSEDRAPDVVLPLLSSFFLMGEATSFVERGAGFSVTEGRIDADIMKNPISRFWFLRTASVISIEGEGPLPDAHVRVGSRLEAFYPDRSLGSAMQRRKISNLLLSIGTLIILLSGYFVLYILLKRTDTLRLRERDFVTSMSHELRTPLSVISATSDNLARGIVEEPEKIKRYGGLIQTQSQRLGKMVESILLYSGIEMMDASRIHIHEIVLKSFFDEIIQSLAPTAEEAGASLRLSIDTQLPFISSDAEALRIIAENLMVNALRHGVRHADNTVSAGEAQEIRVDIRVRPPRTLLLIVEDDGPGIPDNELKNIFQPFSRGTRSKADQTPGSGLGLHIVKRVVTQLGGHISVESPYLEMAGSAKPGARFTVKLPIKIKEDP